jgi:hypothetical protein
MEVSEAGVIGRASFWKLGMRVRNRGHSTRPPLRNGDIVAESDKNKANLFLLII